MLQSMRETAHSWYFKGLMLLLVVSFGIWNIGDMFRGNPLRRTVATAGSVDFSAQELNHEFEQQLTHARQMFQPGLTAQQAKEMGMGENALNDLIENSLVDQDLKRLGIEASDRTALELVAQQSAFKDDDGHFDKKKLQGLLNQHGIKERAFIDNQRKDIAERQMLSAFTDVPPAPAGFLDALYKARAQKRILDIVTLDNASITIDAPNDKALHDYYDQNQKPFTMPETRSFTLAILASDTLAKDITITDEQAKKEYDEKGDQLAEPERRDLIQVVLQDEAKANDVAKAAQASGNIVTASKPTGRQALPINQADEAGLLPELGKPVFALPKGGVSNPIKTALGWHVVQVRDITPAGVPPFDKIKDRLRETMKADQAADAASRIVNQIDDELAAGHSLEDIANSQKLRLVKIENVDAAGKTTDGKDADILYKADALKTAFAQNAGESSPILDDKNGNYFVVRTDNVTPSAAKPFDSVKDQVVAAWKKHEQERRAAADAENIAKALREGKAASSFAKQKGVTVRTSKPISLAGDTDADLDAKTIPIIMRLKKGEATVLPGQGKQTIVRLADIIPAGDSKNADVVGKITADTTGTMPKEFGAQYLHYLRVLYPVHIRGDAMDSISTGSN